MTTYTAHGSAQTTTAWTRLIVPAVLLTSIFVLAEHTLTISLNEHHAATQEEMEAWTAGGDTTRQLAFFSLGAIGLIYGIPFNLQRVDKLLTFFWGGILLWCLWTTFWAIDPWASARRVAVLLLWSVGALGFAIRFKADDIAKIVVIVVGLMIALGLFTELYLGTFNPLAEGYRFAGTVHPNTQAAGCGLLCLAAGALGLMPTKKHFPMIVMMAIGLLFLILTRSRTSLLAMAFGAGMLWVLSAGMRTKVLLGVATILSTTSVLFVVVLTTPDFDQRLVNLALLGRQEQSDSLTGRLPLWEELRDYIERRPLHGYGYQAFWTADHIDAVSREMEWAITEAHSAYVDGILQIGLVGLLFVVALVIVALVRSYRMLLQTATPGIGWIYAGLIFGLVHAATESAMSLPMWVPWGLACGICSLAFHGPADHQLLDGSALADGSEGNVACRSETLRTSNT